MMKLVYQVSQWLFRPVYGGGWGIFYRITKSDSDGVVNWPQNRLSRVGVGISPGLLFLSLPFLFQSKAEGRRQKAEGRRQKAEGRSQTHLRTGDTQDLYANLWNMAILKTRIFTKSFLTPVI